METPGDRLRKARKAAGYDSAAALARRIPDIHESTVRAHEADARGITAKRAQQYSRALRVPADWLLYGGPKAQANGSEVPIIDLDETIMAGIIEAVAKLCSAKPNLPPERVSEEALGLYRKLVTMPKGDLPDDLPQHASNVIKVEIWGDHRETKPRHSVNARGTSRRGNSRST